MLKQISFTWVVVVFGIFILTTAIIPTLNVHNISQMAATETRRHVITKTWFDPIKVKPGDTLKFHYITTRTEPSECSADRFFTKKDEVEVLYQTTNKCNFMGIGKDKHGSTQIKIPKLEPGIYTQHANIYNRYADGKFESFRVPTADFEVIGP